MTTDDEIRALLRAKAEEAGVAPEPWPPDPVTEPPVPPRWRRWFSRR